MQKIIYKGEGRMSTGMTARFVLGFMVVMFGSFAVKTFAADEAGDLKLSKALAQVKLLARLTDVEREAMKSAATLRHCKAGERIIEQGKTMDRMFIIMEGQAEVWLKGKCIATFSGQPLVGEFEFLDMIPASADVILPKETDLIELNYEALNNLMETQPRLGYVLMREIAKYETRRLRDSNPK